MRNSLRTRLLAAILLVVLIAVSVTALVASQRTTGEFQRYIADRGDMRYRRFAMFLGRAYEHAQRWEDVQAEVERMAQMSGQRVVVAGPDGQIVNDSERALIGRMASTSWQPAAVLTARGNPVGFLYVDPNTEPSTADVAFVTAINRSVILGALVASVAAVLATLALSYRIVRPIAHMTQAAERMAKGDLTVRVPVESTDEERRAMLISVASSVSARPEFLGIDQVKIAPGSGDVGFF